MCGVHRHSVGHGLHPCPSYTSPGCLAGTAESRDRSQDQIFDLHGWVALVDNGVHHQCLRGCRRPNLTQKSLIPLAFRRKRFRLVWRPGLPAGPPVQLHNRGWSVGSVKGHKAIGQGQGDLSRGNPGTVRLQRALLSGHSAQPKLQNSSPSKMPPNRACKVRVSFASYYSTSLGLRQHAKNTEWYPFGDCFCYKKLELSVCNPQDGLGGANQLTAWLLIKQWSLIRPIIRCFFWGRSC